MQRLCHAAEPRANGDAPDGWVKCPNRWALRPPNARVHERRARGLETANCDEVQAFRFASTRTGAIPTCRIAAREEE